MLGRLSCPLLVSLHASYLRIQTISPSLLFCEGVVSFARGEKEGSSLCSLPFRSGWKNPDETSSSPLFYPQAWRKHQTGSRPDFILAITRGMRRFGSDLPRFPLKFRWFLEDAVIYSYICVCVCVIINKCAVAVTCIMLHLLILFV